MEPINPLAGVILHFSCDGIDWRELETLFKLAEMGGRAGDKVRRAFENSQVVCFARIGSRLVGASRAITDWEYHAVIYDVVVHPVHQRQGIGKQMMDALIANLPVWRIMLVTEHETTGFYRKLGFDEVQIVMDRFDWPRLVDDQ
jgi:ribosomal protein S18 acetylase RimI-like enzyme